MTTADPAGPVSVPVGTRTPPLRRRVIASGVAVVLVVLLVVNATVYFVYGAALRSSLSQLLTERALSVQTEARAVRRAGGDEEDLARRLEARGLRVLVRDADGNVYGANPVSPRRDGQPVAAGTQQVSRRLDLGGGATAELYAVSGVEDSLRRLVLLQVTASALAVGLAALLLSQASRRALRPVDEIVAAARRTAAGARGERLRPDRPETELGRLAAAYDEVLDELEAGYKVAARLERRSGTLETRWRQVLEAAEEAYVCLDARAQVVDWNRRAERLFGWPRDEILGRPATTLVAERHRSGFLDKVAELTARGPLPAAEPFHLTAQVSDGGTFTAECNVWGVDRRGGGVVHAFVRDVSERRRAEDAAARLAAVVEGSSDAIVTESLEGTILTWNPAAERMYGYGAAVAIGRHISLIVPEDEQAAMDELLARVVRGERVAGREAEHGTRGGTRLPVSFVISPVHDGQGRVVAVSTIARDMTEQRWMAETLDQTLQALQSALGEARASEETTRRFLADAAHQLRTPMAGIRACAETLLRGAEPEDADRLLATMVRETSRAARLISGLLQIARLDQGGPSSTKRPVDVVRLCALEVERLSLLSPGLHVELDVQRPPRGPLMLDGVAVQEILSNLGDNARRHARRTIRIAVDVDRELRVRVEDDGPGVSSDKREEIFDRFVSLDGRGGSGLGLPIGRGLARSCGGDLVYEDGFVLTLPAVPAGSTMVEADG